eukprot:augustus_masked-scaffold_22-processed-gene-4.6-mRNA-1 protein AED:0.13 eAED:0.13 QI:0/0/0/1/1/1/2/0/466
MHVGHLRSTILGEVISRFLSYRGYNVSKINHLGDWGTAFGMLIMYIEDQNVEITAETSLSELNKSKKKFDEDENFKRMSREKVVKLQRGDENEREIWKMLVSISEKGFEEVYRRLDVSFPDGYQGESFYQSRIPALISDLSKSGLLEDEDGAKIIRTKAQKVPLFVQKSDGGAGYDTTDLTQMKYRVNELGLRTLLYVVDAGQNKHFLSCFEVCNKLNWFREAKKSEKIDARHIEFGLVCGKDGKKFKTRSGETVPLTDLLDEAKNRVKKDLLERLKKGETALNEAEIDDASSKLGYSAIKYFDLKNSREKNYIFDYDQMLQHTGNTGIYIMYTYARLCSIERKLKEIGVDVEKALQDQGKKTLTVSASREKEWELALVLLKYGDVMEQVEETLHIHLLCSLLYEMCTAVSKFYSEHQLMVKDPKDPTRKILDPEHGQTWLFLLHTMKISVAELAPILGIDLIERI